MGEETIINLTEKIGLTDGARRNVVRGNTSRETGDITPEGADAERRVTEWRSVETNAFSDHPVALAFRAELETVAVMTGDISCFRGRVDPDDPMQPDEYAPPKPEWVGDGRYNKAEHPVLYLANSTDGVLRELASREGDLWYHQFVVPAGDVRVADLRPNLKLPIVNQAFELAEQADGDEFSRSLADLVSLDFDGMLVPGVRAVNGNTYNNIVLFECSRWFDWLHGSPTRLGRNA